MLSGVNEDIAFPLLQRRPRIVQAQAPLSVIAGKRVMVTGAGGSIGAELVQQVAAMQPYQLVLVELSELNLYEINCTLVESAVAFEVVPLIADVRSHYAMEHVFADYMPQIVFHAAALKHVPLLENDHNLLEAVRTNVTGTLNIAELCSSYGAQLVLVSTDKAVNPSSVMGLTKRLGELSAMAHAEANTDMMLSIVRFGNVLGSSGSFVPLFRRQIAQGGPVTVTHPHMKRFLMTIKEAVSLVLRAAQARNGAMVPCNEAWLPQAPPWLFVLEMGRQVRILDVAEQLIEQAGLRVGVDIVVKFTGIRPGEKLEEELFYDSEPLVRNVIPGVSGCRMPKTAPGMLEGIRLLDAAAQRRDTEAAKSIMCRIVPSYSGAKVWK